MSKNGYFFKPFTGAGIGSVDGFTVIPAGAFAAENEAENPAEQQQVFEGNTPDPNVLPNAIVKNLGIVTVGPGQETPFGVDFYHVFDLIGGSGLPDGTDPFLLQIAMEFIAKDTAEEAAKNYYGNYTTDFFITITGIKAGSFVGNGCYLAGYYPSFGAWVKIPLDGFSIDNGVTYPVITSAGFDFKYTDICSGVQDFICGIYLSEDILKNNPNLKVELALGLSENMEAALSSQFKEVDSFRYDVEDMTVTESPEEPEEPIVETETKESEVNISAEVTVGAEVSENTAEAAKNEIASNNNVKYSSGLDAESNKSVVNQAINAYVEELKDKIEETAVITAETVISIELTKIEGESEKIDSLTFEVEPQIIVKANDVVVDSKEIEADFVKEITFRLPLPSSFDAEYVDVFHNDEKMNREPLKVNASGKQRYVEVESNSFSPFTVKAANYMLDLYQATLELDSIVYLNIYATAEGFADVNLEKNMGLLVWTGDESDYNENVFTIDNDNTTNYPGAKINGSYYGVKTDGIPAKELGDEHYMRVYVKNTDGSYVYSRVIYYGPRTYAINQLKDNTASETLKKTMVAMLDYAAAAQVQFGYKTEKLANDIEIDGVNLYDYRTAYTESMLESVVDADASVVNGWTRDTVKCPDVIGSLVLEGIITNKFSFKFTPAIMEDVQTAKFLFWDTDRYNQILQNGGIFSAENATITKDMVLDTDGFYKAGYDKTAVKNLGDSFYICGVVTTSNGTYTSGVISYSGHRYIQNMLAEDSTEKHTKDLLKCLAVYSDAAKTYFQTN